MHLLPWLGLTMTGVYIPRSKKNFCLSFTVRSAGELTARVFSGKLENKSATKPPRQPRRTREQKKNGASSSHPSRQCYATIYKNHPSLPLPPLALQHTVTALQSYTRLKMAATTDLNEGTGKPWAGQWRVRPLPAALTMVTPCSPDTFGDSLDIGSVPTYRQPPS